MNILKRNGQSVPFDKHRIISAISRANQEVEESARISDALIEAIASDVEDECQHMLNIPSVEDIQDEVENRLIKYEATLVAKKYIKYRDHKELTRRGNSTDESILALLNLSNQELKDENSNKNAVLASTQRDYMAGEVSKDLTKRVILPEDIVEAHEQGIIHFHDADYFAQHIHNCCLINLEDMLQNGTVINGTLIEKPNSFLTACNIATQIVAVVSSSQYGGQSFTLSHLAPFVQVSREKLHKQVEKEYQEAGLPIDEEQISKVTEMRVREEVKSGIQTIQYQLLTLMTTNGQTPFVSVAMYLDEVPEGQTREDLAMIIEEVLNQRILGIKNEKGVYITPAFPKLLYFLDEDNVTPGSKYYYLTELAAKCTAKRMVPDYISVKKMKELKNGDVYPCMGCVDGDEVITYRLHGLIYVESLERMWNRLSDYYDVRTQMNGSDLYMDTDGVEIYDQKSGFVKNYRIIRNKSDKWMVVKFNGGRSLLCTEDHPFETENRGIVLAKDLKNDDLITVDRGASVPEGNISFNTDRAWICGFMLCDSTYYDSCIASITAEEEDDIANEFRRIIESEYGLSVKTIDRQRGFKGQYKDLVVLSDGTNQLISLFGGKTKKDRHIPAEVFSWTRESRMAFLAGMIDADGYVNGNDSITSVQIGSTNKELALQQMMLAQSLGMPATIYLNHYRENCKDNIRYRVEFTPCDELINVVRCKKKKAHFGNLVRTNQSILTKQLISPMEITAVDREAYSYDVTTETGHFTVSGLWSHNCRSFLTPDRTTENVANAKNYQEGHGKYYGRFNQGVVTINLPDVACASNGDMDKFWSILEDRLELCHRALRCKHERLLGTVSDVAPILWQHGALARLQPGETIDKLLYGGYSTISLGYSGIYEMCVRMTGKSHTTPEGRKFALEVMQKLNDKCAEWKAAENIDYSVYGTPMESTTYKFAKATRKRYGIIKDVTDHNYIANSYHVCVREQIDAFEKLRLESEFQQLSPGGAISYVEVPDMQNNIPAVISVIQFIYDNIMYAELNTKSDYCQCCGYDGEIKIVEDNDGKLVWECPNCGNRDQTKMNVARRTCGYIGTQYWNQGRTEEIKDRVMHL